MFDISPIQIMLVLALALIVFGPKRLPELGRNLGRGLRDFKGGLSGETVEADPTAARVSTAPDGARPAPVRVVADEHEPPGAPRAA